MTLPVPALRRLACRAPSQKECVMAARPLGPGDTGYLVPRNDTAPSAAYRQPKVTVIRRNGPRLVVQLDDETQIETDERNVLRNRPAPTEHRRPRSTRRLAANLNGLPEGSEELPLW